MKKYLLFITCSLLISSVTAESQDLYIGGSISSHELENETGSKFAVHLASKNIYENNLFVGGEIEAAIFDNNDFEDGKEKYSFSANVPLGMRFQLGKKAAIDLYALVGYSAMRLDFISTEETINGFKWGAGIDTSLANWQVGVRYTQTKLDNSLVKELTEENIGLIISHKLNL